MHTRYWSSHRMRAAWSAVVFDLIPIVVQSVGIHRINERRIKLLDTRNSNELKWCTVSTKGNEHVKFGTPIQSYQLLAAARASMCINILPLTRRIFDLAFVMSTSSDASGLFEWDSWSSRRNARSLTFASTRILFPGAAQVSRNLQLLNNNHV